MFNREVMQADLKIAIGCVTAHAQAGFSGGSKLFLPGVAHVDSIAHYHLDVESMAKETTGMGRHENNILRQEINEAAAMARVDFLLNVVVNGRGETTALYAGELFQAHDATVAAIPSSVKVILMTAYADRTLLDWFANPEAGTIVPDWDTVMELVVPHHGQGTHAAVLPNATMQYFA